MQLKKKKTTQEELDKAYMEAKESSDKWYEDEKWKEVVNSEKPKMKAEEKPKLAPIPKGEWRNVELPYKKDADKLKEVKKLKLIKARAKSTTRKMTDGKVWELKDKSSLKEGDKPKKKLKLKKKEVKDTNNTKLKLWMH